MLYFRLSFYNRYVAIINVCDPLPARVLREAQEAGPANAFEDQAFSFNKMAQSSDCGKTATLKDGVKSCVKTKKGK
jgi:hypothetical protein